MWSAGSETHYVVEPESEKLKANLNHNHTRKQNKQTKQRGRERERERKGREKERKPEKTQTRILPSCRCCSCRLRGAISFEIWEKRSQQHARAKKPTRRRQKVQSLEEASSEKLIRIILKRLQKKFGDSWSWFWRGYLSCYLAILLSCYLAILLSCVQRGMPRSLRKETNIWQTCSKREGKRNIKFVF